MTENILLMMTFATGILLCFYGFKMFRLSMSLAGFYIGLQLGRFLYGLTASNFPDSWKSNASLLFPIITAILLAILSYAIYKQALFFLTMLFTTFSVMKIFVLYVIKTDADLEILNRLSPDSVEKLKATKTGTESVLSDADVGNILAQLPGQDSWQKLLIVLLVALAIGVIAGILICAIQEPAIKIATSVIGGDAISIGIMDSIGRILTIKNLPDWLSSILKKGDGNLWVALVAFLLFTILGCTVQLKQKDG